MNLSVSNWAMLICLLVFAGLIWWLETSGLDDVSGQAKVIDGDSLVLPSGKVRLKGIDAPEGRQDCTKNGQKWACGRAAAQMLRRMVTGKEVVCEGRQLDRYDRLLAFCRVGELEINRAMVREGWAVSFGDQFLKEEHEARAGRRGLWQGTFERPAEWRAKDRVFKP